MATNVFVYGTLLVRGGNHRVISPFATLIRPAKIQGTLYHTHYGYPAVDVEGNDQVIGELVRLDDEQAALQQLDRYEGVKDARFGLYRRIEVKATLLEPGETVPEITTWVYAINPDQISRITPLRIPDGDWLTFLRRRHKETLIPWQTTEEQA